MATDAEVYARYKHMGLPPDFAVAMAGGSGSSAMRDALNGQVVTTNTTSGTAASLPALNVATMHQLTLTGTPCVLTFPAAVAGKTITLSATQGAGGTRLITWPAAVKWAGGTAPTLSTTAGKIDVFQFSCLDGATWVGHTVGLDVR